MSKPGKSGGTAPDETSQDPAKAGKDEATQGGNGQEKSSPAAGASVKVFGVEIPVAEDDLLASKDYGDHVVVVTRDGRKLTLPKQAAK
jgi:hypothetical protein